MREGSKNLIDTHVHLDHKRFEHDRDQVVERAKSGLVWPIITIGVDLVSSKKAVEYTPCYPGLKATVGIHPHEASSGSESTLNEIKSLAGSRGVVAVGEIGLDYYYDFSPRDIQRQVFAMQINIAKELGIPIVVHIRDAYDDAIDILKSEQAQNTGGVVHCFSGNAKQARDCLDMGFYISVGGILTFPDSSELHQIIRDLPLDRILLETDAPYLTAVPLRGKRNEPSYVVHVAQTLASLKKVSFSDVAGITTANACKLFKLEIEP